jgi:hypothetical protein
LAAVPELFDVVVVPNLYGDIVSDVTAELSGSVGLGASANIGERAAMFEAIQASKPPASGPAPDVENVLVDRAEYQRLKTCVALLEKAYADYGAQDEGA